jgi:spore maturation protein CgeB
VRIHISAYSDLEKTEAHKPRWGDYWFKEHLKNTFRELGCTSDDKNPSLFLHLFGHPLSHIPEHSYNILWIHSHPDWITPDILKSYNKVYCISKSFTQKIREKLNIDIKWLPYPTHMRSLNNERHYDIVFVGNNRRARKGRKIINDLVSLTSLSFKIRIWGLGWNELVPSHWYGGDYFDHLKLNELYSISKIVLNDHHEDMRREGFINPRILDALASGSLVITDNLFRIEDIISAHVPLYQTKEELRYLLTYYLNNNQEREKLIKEAQTEALKYTYKGVCRRILEEMKKNGIQ